MAATVDANLIRKLDEIDAEHRELDAKLVDPAVLADHRQVRSLSIKKAAIDSLVRDYRGWRQAQREMDELQAVISEGAYADLVALARDEASALKPRAAELIASIRKRLVTADDQSVGSVLLAVRAGV